MTRIPSMSFDGACNNHVNRNFHIFDNERRMTGRTYADLKPKRLGESITYGSDVTGRLKHDELKRGRDEQDQRDHSPIALAAEQPSSTPRHQAPSGGGSDTACRSD